MGCTNAPYLYIPGNQVASEAFLKLALAAKTEAGLKIKAQGACSDDAHMLIDYLIVTN
ncbi:hypothetical protein GMA8713_03967 [Grimontia marina]|uniref:Uncharacterized protein n=1 Tax=Grimontia marina TaxID=646534 RepID=A0A128FI02_9GAMM|nr:hypothetical protein GMA8713_03967 [Grimontia marina]